MKLALNLSLSFVAAFAIGFTVVVVLTTHNMDYLVEEAANLGINIGAKL